jgi:prevent-host-death family protein
MEREVPIERDAQLEQLVSEAEQGESIVLTRDGVPVASIVPRATRSEADRARALKAVEDIRRLSRGQSLGGLSIKDLINEGRKY